MMLRGKEVLQLSHVLQSLQTNNRIMYSKKNWNFKETNREYVVERKKLENYLLIRRESKDLWGFYSKNMK